MSLGEEDYYLVGPFATYINKNGSDQISNRPFKRKKRSSSRGSRHRERHPRHQKHGRGRPKKDKKRRQSSQTEIEDPRSKRVVKCTEKNQDVPSRINKNKSPSKSGSSPNNRMRCSSRNKNRGSSRNVKNAKRRKCSLGQEHEHGFSGQNVESGSSGSSYVTCCEDLNPYNTKNARQVYKNGVHFYEIDGPSRIMTENSASSSEEKSSQDSIFQELKAHNSKAVASNSKDLKKWIKNCRRGCRG